MTSDTNPITLAQACAVRSGAHRSRIGSQPAAASVPMSAPTATFASASV